MEQLLTTAQICEELQISKSTLTRIAQRGELPCLRVGGQLRFYRADVDAYLRQARTAAPKLGGGRRPVATQAMPQPRRKATQKPEDLESYLKGGVYKFGMPYVSGMKVTIPTKEEIERWDAEHSPAARQKKSARTAGTGSGAGTQKRTTGKTILQQAERPVKTGGVES